MAEQQAYMFPTSVKEVERLGWDYIDIILVTGDAFVDHPSFGTAVIGRCPAPLPGIAGKR